MNINEIKQEHISKAEDRDGNVIIDMYEVSMPVVNHETVTFNMNVLNADVKAAEEVVNRRKSELASAEKYLASLISLRTKIKKVT